LGRFVRRGDIVTVAASGGFGGKPRPAVIVQSDQFDSTLTLTICLFTSDPADAPLFRVAIIPTIENGLVATSWLMTDKIIAVRRTKIGRLIGRLAADDLLRLNRALAVFLGLAS
jgi:mRNA interferase MazF